MARTRSQEHYDSRRESLLDAAWEFLLEQGYERATLNRVIAHAGTSKGAFYHYFDSREELIEALIDRATRGAIDEIERGLGDRKVPALEKLNRYLGISANRPSATAPLRRLVFQVHMAGDFVLRDRLRGRANALSIPPLERIVEQGISEGVVETPYPSEIAEVIHSAWDSTLIEVMQLLQSDVDADRVTRDLLRRVEATVHATERLLGMAHGTLDRTRPKDARRLVERSRRENLA